MAARSASPPPATSYNVETVAAARPGMSPSELTPMMRVRSWLSMIGNGSRMTRQDAGLGSSRLPSGPSTEASDVTTCSRTASSGGFVTCANSWVK